MRSPRPKKETRAERRARLKNRLERVKDDAELPPWDADETTDVIDITLARLEASTRKARKHLAKSFGTVTKAGQEVNAEVRRLRESTQGKEAV